MSCYGSLFCISFASFHVMFEALPPSVLCTESVPSISPGVPLGCTQLPQHPLIMCSGGFPVLNATNDAVTDTLLPAALWTRVSSPSFTGGETGNASSPNDLLRGYNVVVKNMALVPDTPGQITWPQSLRFLCLSFHIRKMEMIKYLA